MPIAEITSRYAVLRAIAEYDALGRDAFLGKYGYGQASEYFLSYMGRLYDSNAILGVAYRYQYPDRGPLRHSEFSGGIDTVVSRLQKLGFTVISTRTAVGGSELSLNPSSPIYGHVPGYPPGSTFGSRRGLAHARIHRPLQAGIAGSANLGAESIVLSGGYEDDEDRGNEIIYTGEGGRDANSGEQAADQTLTGHNLALVKSMNDALPVRVIRGAALTSPFAPASGYRYDGLYLVVDAWHQRGRAGFTVRRYRLVKVDDYAVPVTDITSEQAATPPPRVETLVSRVARDAEASRRVKELYDFSCQVCGIRLEGPGGPYAEAAHIRPLGSPHDGPDELGNLLCLCPNHHVLLDLGAFTIEDDFQLVGIPGRLRVELAHHLDTDCLRYRREHYSRVS